MAPNGPANLPTPAPDTVSVRMATAVEPRHAWLTMFLGCGAWGLPVAGCLGGRADRWSAAVRADQSALALPVLGVACVQPPMGWLYRLRRMRAAGCGVLGGESRPLVGCRSCRSFGACSTGARRRLRAATRGVALPVAAHGGSRSRGAWGVEPTVGRLPFVPINRRLLYPCSVSPVCSPPWGGSTRCGTWGSRSRGAWGVEPTVGRLPSAPMDQRLLKRCTASTSTPTWSGLMSGDMPCPRLNTWPSREPPLPSA